MHLLWILLATTGAVCAQLAPGLELLPCAIICIAEELLSSQCEASDIPCLCSSKILWPSTSTCIQSNCTVLEGKAFSKAAAEACNIPPRDRSEQYVQVSVGLCAISFAFVMVRLIASQLKLHVDDVLAIMSWTLTMPVAVLNVYQAKYGMGKDIWQVPDKDVTRMFLMFYISELFYGVGTSSIKVTLLAFYIRIFPHSSVQRISWAMIWIIIIMLIAIFFAVVFQCTPVEYAWRQWDGAHVGQCRSFWALAYANGALTVLVDLLILILPMPTIYKLRVDWKKKLQVSVMFSVGVIVVVVSTLRLIALFEAATTKNGTWDYWAAGLWSTAEIYVSIICACLPATRLVLQRAWHSISSSKLLSGSGSGSDATSSSTRGMQQLSPALTLGSNQISLRTSITVSSPGELFGDDAHCAVTLPHDYGDFSGGVPGYNCRTRTTITAGVLPKSPW